MWCGMPGQVPFTPKCTTNSEGEKRFFFRLAVARTPRLDFSRS